MRLGHRLRASLALLAALLLLPPRLRAEEMALSAEAQIPLLLKVLTYDRNFEKKAGKELALGVVHDPSDRDSAKATDEVGSTLFKFTGRTVKIKCKKCGNSFVLEVGGSYDVIQPDTPSTARTETSGGRPRAGRPAPSSPPEPADPELAKRLERWAEE